MFFKAIRFNQPLSNWDVPCVTNMWSMFLNAYDFNQPLNWLDKINRLDKMFLQHLGRGNGVSRSLRDTGVSWKYYIFYRVRVIVVGK